MSELASAVTAKMHNNRVVRLAPHTLSPVEYKMELTRKILIYSAFIGLGVVASILRVWVLDCRRNSFKEYIKGFIAASIVFATIAAIAIYINN